MQPPRFLVCGALAVLALCRATAADNPELWSCNVAFPVAPKGDKPQPPGTAYLWIPEGVGKIRGLLFPGTIIIGAKLARDPLVRAALAEQRMGGLYLDPGLGSNLIRGGGEKLEGLLRELAAKSGHPEIAFAPLLPAGHSTDGLFCRNVAYWKPDRVIGVLMLKSGNFPHAIEDLTRSLAGVPLIMISGEFEEYGPEGGDLGVGLRSQYSDHPTDKKKQNQTQWVMARMQMLGRRQKNADNLWALVVHRGKGHTSWDDEMRDLTCKIIRSFAEARIPAGDPDSLAEVRCVPLTAKEGWLYDADIKAPAHATAPFANYAGNKVHAFWVPDKALAEAITTYHARGWTVADPTASDPPETRFAPPPELADLIDAPPPVPLEWGGGDGAWSTETASWRDQARPVAWDASRMAVFAARGGTVTLPANVTSLGLQVGPGYTLDLGTSTLRCKWHADLARGSTLLIRISTDPTTGKTRAGKIQIDGNAKLAGSLRVETDATNLKGGRFTILSMGGLQQGDFGEVRLPEGWTMEKDRRGWNVIPPKPGAAPGPATP